MAHDLSSGERGNLAAVADDVEVREGNLKRWEFADAATEGIDRVFHLAADHGGRD